MLVTTTSNLDPYGLDERHLDIQSTACLLDVLKPGLQKTASTGGDALNSIVKALARMGIKANIDLGELLKRLADSEGITKEATDKSGESEETTVKIASKKIKDSHYFFDVSRDVVSKEGKSLILVSAYMREGYLGRYLIKRNFWFLPDNGVEASEIYGNLVKECQRTKKRYYDDKIKISDIFPEVKSFLDGTRGDLEFENEDSAGTATYRNRETGHSALESTPYGRAT